MSIKIIIASKNPVKIEATRIGFQKMFKEKEFELKGISVPSNVSDQPMGDQETLQGAINRATNAKAKFPNADFWVGIEGGISLENDEMNAFAWIVIQSDYKIGKAKTSSFYLPQKVAQLVKAGKELGEADDLVFGRTNSKQSSGAVGILTENVIDRTALYVPAVILALIPFKNPILY